jgi:hypothetical protein
MTPTPITPPTPNTPPAQNGFSATLKSLFAILAGGGLTFLAGLQQGTSLKQSGISAGAAALATLIAFLTRSPVQ